VGCKVPDPALWLGVIGLGVVGVFGTQLGACAPEITPIAHCTLDRDCDDGFVCSPTGTCTPVTSDIGQRCAREADCGANQTCRPTVIDDDADKVVDRLAATCQQNGAGTVGEGGRCFDDGDCLAGACALGRCTGLCEAPADCRSGQTCAGVPRLLESLSGGAGAEGWVSACVPNAGIVAIELAVSADAEVEVPVPSHARSFTLVVEGPDEDALVAVDLLEAPSGGTLYRRPETPDEVWTQPLRYLPQTGASSLMVPASTASALELGVYRAKVRTQALGAVTPPRVRVLYRLGSDGQVLDVNVHLVDLAEHPCVGAGMHAAQTNDPNGAFSGQFLATWRAVFSAADLSVGQVIASDVVGRPELAQVDTAQDLRELFKLSRPGAPALDVFIVRSIYPLGVTAIVGGTPGPFAAGTTHSGVVLSADAVCDGGWAGLGRLAARSSLRYLGLWETVDLDGHPDPLESTGVDSQNLLYFGNDGAALTSEQAELVRRNPLLR
jgi:hypothetical protein